MHAQQCKINLALHVIEEYHTDSTTSEVQVLALSEEACETFGDLWVPYTVQSTQSWLETSVFPGPQCANALVFLGDWCNFKGMYDIQRVSGVRDFELCPEGTFTRVVNEETPGNVGYECCPARFSLCAATPSLYTSFFCKVRVVFLVYSIHV